MKLPFEDSSFDAATMGYGLRNVTDKLRALAELHRVLRPGRRVAILVRGHILSISVYLAVA